MIEAREYVLIGKNIDIQEDLPVRFHKVHPINHDDPDLSLSSETKNHDVVMVSDRLRQAANQNESVWIVHDSQPASLSTAVLVYRALKETVGDCNLKYVSSRFAKPEITWNTVYELEMTDADLVLFIGNMTAESGTEQALKEYGIDVFHFCSEPGQFRQDIDSAQVTESGSDHSVADIRDLLTYLYSLDHHLPTDILEKLLPLAAAGIFFSGVPLTGIGRTFVLQAIKYLETNSDIFWSCLLEKFRQSPDDLTEELFFRSLDFLRTTIEEGNIKDTTAFFKETVPEERNLTIKSLEDSSHHAEAALRNVMNDLKEDFFRTPTAVCNERQLLTIQASVPDTMLLPAAEKGQKEFSMPVLILSRHQEKGSVQFGFSSGETTVDRKVATRLRDRKYSVKICPGGLRGSTESSWEQTADEINQILFSSGLDLDTSFPVTIDLELDQDELIPESCAEIDEFRPYDPKAGEPLFLCRHLKIASLQRTGENGKDLQIEFKPDDPEAPLLAAFGTGLGDYQDILTTGIFVDIIFKLKLKDRKADPKLILELETILYQPVFEQGTGVEEDELFREDLVTLPEILDEYKLEPDVLMPSSRDLNQVYSVLKELIQEADHLFPVRLESLAPEIATRSGSELTLFKIARCIDILSEGGFIKRRQAKPGMMFLDLAAEDSPRTRLSHTETYKKMTDQLQEAGIKAAQ